MAALGSKLVQLQAKACEATWFAGRHGCAYHTTLMKKNKQFVVQPPTIEKCQDLSKQLFYTRIARKLLDRVISVEYAFRDDSEPGDKQDKPSRGGGGYGRQDDSPYRRSVSPVYRRS